MNTLVRKIVLLLWRYFSILREYVTRYRPLFIVFGVFFLVILPMVCSRNADPQYYNNPIGYSILIPPGWEISEVKEKPESVIFRKPARHNEPEGTSVIRVDIDIGNPYGPTAKDFIEGDVIPRVYHTYQQKAGQDIRFDSDPYFEERNHIQWATTKFHLDFYEVQSVYVTLIDDLVVSIRFMSKSRDQDKDEKLFYKVLDSLVLNIDSRNYFMQHQ